MKLNTVTKVQIDNSKINPKKNAILKLLGYEDTNCDEHTSNVIDTYLNITSSLIEPKGGFILYHTNDLTKNKEVLNINNNEFAIHKIISSQLKGTNYIAAFICTIGSKVEQLSKKEMQQGNMLEGYVLDLIGSEAAEETAEFVHQVLRKLALEEGLGITNRFSPGYCNWDIAEQFKLFNLFGEETYGIQLNDSALMSPIKSISGIVGIGKNVTFKPYTCTMCSDEKCIYRNKKS